MTETMLDFEGNAITVDYDSGWDNNGAGDFEYVKINSVTDVYGITLDRSDFEESDLDKLESKLAHRLTALADDRKHERQLEIVESSRCN